MIKKFIKSVFVYLLVFLIGYLVSSQFLFRYVVNGNSMSPRLINGDEGFALRTTLGLKQLNRFDIVVIDDNGNLLVKRIIGLPNEEIEYIDNKLFVNGSYLEESFIKKGNTNNFSTYTDGYFCLGDNREHSLDSRIKGSFSKEQIVAVLINFND